jgi:hypothetical protein
VIDLVNAARRGRPSAQIATPPQRSAQFIAPFAGTIREFGPRWKVRRPLAAWKAAMQADSAPMIVIYGMPATLPGIIFGEESA